MATTASPLAEHEDITYGLLAAYLAQLADEPEFHTRATAVRERAGELLLHLRATRGRILQAGGDAEGSRAGIQEIAREAWTLRAGLDQ